MSHFIDDVTVNSTFAYCSAVSTNIGEGAQQAIDCARSTGGNFLRLKKTVFPPSWRIHPEPAVEMDEEGNFILWLEFAHPLLLRDIFDNEEGMKVFNPVGKFSFIQSSRTVNIAQTGDANDPENFDRMAHGHLSLGRLLYRSLRPQYGYIDEMGENAPADTTVKKLELQTILWANFFGPDYVRKFGRDFLLGAPGWKKEELGDGGILYVVTESLLDWRKNPQGTIINYFRSQIPAVKAFRAVMENW